VTETVAYQKAQELSLTKIFLKNNNKKLLINETFDIV
jgi:hypothetical protein